VIPRYLALLVVHVFSRAVDDVVPLDDALFPCDADDLANIRI
jgi:hypothetical protein